VKAAGGSCQVRGAEGARATKQLVADARELGFELDLDAARLLVERLARALRLRNELERLALWSGDDGHVMRPEQRYRSTPEEAIWSLADAGRGRRAG
jgi:DNA polymerase III delta subunit